MRKAPMMMLLGTGCSLLLLIAGCALTATAKSTGELSWYFDVENDSIRKTKQSKGKKGQVYSEKHHMFHQRHDNHYGTPITYKGKEKSKAKGWGKRKKKSKGKGREKSKSSKAGNANVHHGKHKLHPPHHKHIDFHHVYHSMSFNHEHPKHHHRQKNDHSKEVNNHEHKNKPSHTYEKDHPKHDTSSHSYHYRRSHHTPKHDRKNDHSDDEPSLTSGQPATKKLNATLIPKFVDDLPIPSVLYDARNHTSVKISLRQISQQILPSSYPETTLWAYGNPDIPSSFSHPSGTIENTEFKRMTVTWMNELVVDPEKCSKNPESDACNYLVHVIQDKNGVPIVDQTLHWAAPNQKCASGKKRTDCRGSSTAAYTGPVPITTHVHGAHVESHSDGYPESWFLPKANNIPSGYKTEGRFYSTNGEYSKGPSEGAAKYRYDNSETTTTLFYHDHTLGLTRLNAYASGAGFWLIREANDREDYMGKNQNLPGPPPAFGQNPNTEEEIRKKIREIPIVMQQMSFYEDGRLFYPANRVYHANSTCSDGDVFAQTSGMPNIPFLPSTKSDLSPTWNPEAFFDTWVVNGRTWPKLDVAPERYRFRLLNFADSASLNIFCKTSDGTQELTIYVIGSEQGLLPNVVGIRTGKYISYFQKKKTEVYYSETATFTNESEALLIDPGERYDVIIDFSEFSDGTEIIMYNTAPDAPFQGFDSPDYVPADIHTTGKVMKFIVKDELKNPDGDKSTLPWQLHNKAVAPKSDTYDRTRDLVILEADSNICVDQTSCDASPTKCDGTNSFGPTMAMLGYGRHNTSTPSMWDDPICMNPSNGTTEILVSFLMASLLQIFVERNTSVVVNANPQIILFSSLDIAAFVELDSRRPSYSPSPRQLPSFRSFRYF